MGQSTSFDSSGSRKGDSTDNFSDELDFLHEQIRKHSLTLRQLTLLTYDDLLTKINELNALSSKYVDCNGKQLLFEVKTGTDTSVLWKGTVRIKCIKIDPTTQKIEKTRELYLKQFLQVYNTMQLHLNASKKTEENENKERPNNDLNPVEDSHQGPSEVPNSSQSHKKTVTLMDASLFMDKLTPIDIQEEGSECCICMESKHQVSLPCAHSYCLACIEQWNVDHKTCPICREKLDNTDDTWVLEEHPLDDEVKHEIQKSFFDLTR